MKSLTNEQARSANSLGKKTEDHFILNFFNRKDGSINSFDPFYSATSLSKATNINVLPELNMALDEIKYLYKVVAQELSFVIDVPAKQRPSPAQDL